MSASGDDDGVNPRLREERAGATVRPRALGTLIYGGEQSFGRMLEIQELMQCDPVFDTSDRPFLNHTQRYLRSAQKMGHFHTKMANMGLTEREFKWAYAAIDEVLPTDVHMAMVIPALEFQTSAEQRARWLPLAKSFKILCAYVQTELGHGSNVRGLETTATYDVNAQQWDIHSPTLTSTKWWPGGLGKTATHALLMARVIVNGKDHGISPFFLQIRDMGTHMPLPGIAIGDIGPKLGFNSTDNGFMRFHRVRVPRDAMLMGVAEVTPEGDFRRIPGGDKLAYGAMLDVRANLVIKASISLARALTIAIRFSAVRRQGFAGEGTATADERPVLDYPTQQRGLFPLLAYAYALHFTGERMRVDYEAYLHTLDQGALPALHATSAGLKALVTQTVADGIETARKLCGGHGYSHASGLPDASANYLALPTLEGTQQVLEPQMARFLLRGLAAARRGGGAPPAGCEYLASERQLLAGGASGAALDLLDPAVQLRLFQRRALVAVLALQVAVAELTAAGVDAAEALGRRAAEAGRAARAHCQLHLLQHFAAAVQALQAQASAGPCAAVINEREAAVLRDLCSLFALSTIEADLGQFRDQDTISSQDARQVLHLISDLCASIRPEAVALVDAFHFSDKYLGSAIGRFDGNIYPALMEWALREPLNASEVAESLPHIKLLVGTHPGARL
ncbi:palmitoyl-CoA oxidase [Tribonema minus]|uniref:Acyl-coenzyme A oxidase n=1 Tax=Tribonema minus TaxID=303371 RepID=A0A836CMS5_9STRA|nr:palmitoyl-CoA oxidase [Tribonema minus]